MAWAPPATLADSGLSNLNVEKLSLLKDVKIPVTVEIGRTELAVRDILDLEHGSIVTLDKLRIDDPVGAISVHGVVGIWGLLAVCFTNDDASFVWQLIGIVSIFAWVFVTSFIVWFVLMKTIGIRVSEEEEYEGVDISECGLEAYPEFTSAE